jgi:FkbM family methyltransferase
VALLDTLWGKKTFQPVFDRLYRVALKGMNYGRASDYRNNGEVVVLNMLRSMIKTPTPVLFDVGANKGEFTRRIMDTWGSASYQLYAFEPSHKTFEMLKSAVVASSSVHLINQGLGEKEETVDLYYDREGSGLASVYPRDLAFRKIDFKEHENISLTTLDIFCSKHHITTIDFLKLDVEGHELAVLKGGRRMFTEGNIKAVQFEFGGCNIDSRTFFKDYFSFFAKDFKLYRILSNGLREIVQYSEALEVFQSANYLALKR